MVSEERCENRMFYDLQPLSVFCSNDIFIPCYDMLPGTFGSPAGRLHRAMTDSQATRVAGKGFLIHLPGLD